MKISETQHAFAIIYYILKDDNFYGLAANYATLTDICDRCKVSLSALTGDLFAR